MSLFYALIGCILVCCHLELKISIFILICFLTVSRIIFASFCFCPMLFLHLYTFKLFAQTWMCFCQRKKKYSPTDDRSRRGENKMGERGEHFPVYIIHIYNNIKICLVPLFSGIKFTFREIATIG